MNKTVLITGASRGIGFELAQCFIKNNDTVIGASRSKEIRNITNENFHSYLLDLSNQRSIIELSESLQKNNGLIDMLINNAGIGPDLDALVPEEGTLRDTFNVNLDGTVFLTESILPLIKPGGKIINISSKMGAIHSCVKSDSPAYRMSKAALNMYTKILTNRLMDKILVAAIHPGWVRTSISKNSSENGRLSPHDSANRIFKFVTNEFRSGVFWNVEAQEEIPW